MRAALITFLAALSALVSVDAVAVQQAFLVQNSGWMEPFYSDPGSQLKPLVAAVAQVAASPGDHVFTVAFSQNTGENVSPKLIGEAQGGGGVAGHLAALGVARKGAGPTLADTDFREAVTKTISGPFKSNPGILWIFTNNKNSPGNDPATADRNRDFYQLLHLDQSIAKTLVYPLKMPVHGKIYSARGIMVYALAYGKPASDALDQILSEGRLSKVLNDLPARLKPVDQDSVRIVPKAVTNAPNIFPSMGADSRTLVFDVDAADIVPRVVLQASLQNQFYPYVISTATVGASLNAAGEMAPVEVIPATVRNLQPGAHHQVEVHFTLPMAQIPSAWSMQAMSAMGKQVSVPMTVRLNLAGQKLMLTENYSSKLKELFPGDPISEVFMPPASISASEVLVPMLVRIQYPMLPLVTMLGGLLAAVLGLVSLGMLSVQKKRYNLVVDGVPRHVMLKPFGMHAVKTGDGQLVGEVRRGFGKPRVVNVVPGHTLAVR